MIAMSCDVLRCLYRSLKACGRVVLESGYDGTKFFGAERYRPEVLECMLHTRYSNSDSKLFSCSCVNSGMLRTYYFWY